MSKTGFKCPMCGHTKAFEAYDVPLRSDLEITERGWYWSGKSYDRIDLDNGTMIACLSCGYEGKLREFDEEEA